MAMLKGDIQENTATLAAGTSSVTASLTSVDTAKSFLVFSCRFDDASPGFGNITGQITNSTTITFARAASASSPAVTIRWKVVEFSSGVTVQRGASTFSGTVNTNNVPLTSVNTAKSFALITHRGAGTQYDSDDFVRARITSSTNLELSETDATDPQGTTEWQVIEYDTCSVQQGDVAFASGDSSKPATVTSVDTAKSLLLFSYKSATGTVANIGQKMIRGIVTNSTTLTFDRNNTGQALDLTWFLVSFTDIEIVRSGSQSFVSGDSTKNVTISSVVAAESVPFAGGIGHRGGKTSLSTDDNPGHGTGTLTLSSSTQLDIQRTPTLSSADFGWFVVQFPGPNVSATLSGDATLSGGGMIDFASVDAPLSAVGSVSPVAGLDFSDTLSLTGNATATAANDLIVDISLTLLANGTLAASSEFITNGDVSLSANGQLVVGGTIECSLDLILTADGTLVSVGGSDFSDTVTLSGNSTAASLATTDHHPSVLLTVDGTVSVQSILDALGELSLSGNAGLSAGSELIAEALATLSANGTLSSDSIADLIASASLSGNATVILAESISSEAVEGVNLHSFTLYLSQNKKLTVYITQSSKHDSFITQNLKKDVHI